jgi:hypothetical protein
MSNEHGQNGDVLQILRKEKVITIKRLVDLLHCCERTVQRHLRKWPTYTSYNCNGRYYTLPDIPQFDEYGLWGYRGIFFSRNGNLRHTIVALITNAPAGLAVSETADLVKVPLRSFMAQGRNLQKLQREKIAGRYVYFSSDEATYTEQKKKREEDEARARLSNMPTDGEAVVILVERINHPELSVEQLCLRLNKKGRRIKREIIRNLFECHGLLKKTTDSRQ